MRCYLITPFLLLALGTQGFNSQAQSFRVKRIQREQHTFPNNAVVKTDSAVLYYSGTNAAPVTWQWAESISLDAGLLYSPNALGNDSLESKIDHSKNAAWGLGDKGAYRTVQQYNAFGQMVNFTHRYFLPNGQYSGLKAAEYYIYAGNTLTENKIGDYRYVHNYQNGILQYSDIFYPSSTNSWGKRSYYYDQTGNLIGTFEVGDNNMDTTKVSYSYDNQNRLIEYLHINNIYTGFTDTVWIERYIYNTNGDMVQEDHFSKGSSSIHQKAMLLSTYDNQHRKTELISHYRRDPKYTLDMQDKRTFIYDNNGLLTKLETQKWDGNQWVSAADTSAASSSHTYTFEYEVAWPTGVPEVEEANNVKLYPSPASDFIRIETEWKQAQPFTAAILDMQGRVVRQWNEPATKNYARTIPLTELPAGSYFIKLSSGEQQYTKQFAVYK